MNITNYQDYRLFLNDVLKSRLSKNQTYSLRAFARDLEIAPQVLSGLLRFKRGLSTGRASQLAARLNLNEDETLYFCDLVEVYHGRTKETRAIASLRLKRSIQSADYQILSEDVFKSISEWYHYALLELTFVKNFKSEPRWIAKRLRISTEQAGQAVQRLKRLGLLTLQNGKLCKTSRNISTTHNVPSEAVRLYTAKVLERALEALEFQSVTERDCTTVTMAIDPKRLQKAKELIKNFRRKLCEYLEQGERTEVYTLAIQLFRLSHPILKESRP